MEGVILRDPAGLYKFGRSGKTGPLLKVKRFIDFEAEVVGVYEEMHNANEAKTNELGRTERSTAKAGLVGKGTLGGLVLRALNGPAEGVEFRCGTGFDADARKVLWKHRERLTGKTAKIKSFPIGVKDKPRHPVWLGWRDMDVDGPAS
jgi:DNA ligase-1